MGDKTGIEWTQGGSTWNPLTGCQHVSPGCDNCYAAKESGGRLKNHPAHVGLTVKGAKPAHFTGEVRLLSDRLNQPLRWKRPRKIFVNSMSDLFHKDVPDEFIAKVFAVMALCPQHTFQVLTKRPQRMKALLTEETMFAFKHSVDAAAFEIDAKRSRQYVWSDFDIHRPFHFLPNVWLGVSIENDSYTFRADHLRATPAAVRFISAEPLLGSLPSLDLTEIDWLIVGGESGPGARPMHPQTERAMLVVFNDWYGGDVTRADLEELTGYSASSSSMDKALSKLRVLGFIVGMKLSDDFAEAIRE